MIDKNEKSAAFYALERSKLVNGGKYSFTEIDRFLPNGGSPLNYSRDEIQQAVENIMLASQ